MSLKKVDAAEDIMTASGASRILGVSVDMVRILARGGNLPFMSTTGGVRLFRRADVDALAQRRERAKARPKSKAAR